MKLNVTFSQKDMSFHPAFDTVLAIDTGDARVQSLLEGAMSGTYENSEITYLRMGALAQCENLTAVRLPNCTRFRQSRQFYECKNVTELYLPKLTEMEDGTYSFYGMSTLKTISLPELTTIAAGFSGTLWGCEEAQRIELPKLGGATIQTYAFRNCKNLHTLVLGGDTVNPLANTNAFYNAGSLPGVMLSVYVPDHLVDSYKTATNWSAMANKIKPISEMGG